MLGHPGDLPVRRGHALAFKLRRRPGRDRVLAGSAFAGVQPRPLRTDRVAVAVAVAAAEQPRLSCGGVIRAWCAGVDCW